MKTKTVDITENRQALADFIKDLGHFRQPIDLVQSGQLVARLIPPSELSEKEKAEVIRKGWEFVEQARARNKGVPEREIARAVDAAVKRVRSRE